MAIVALGWVRQNGHIKPEEARVYETRKTGTEYAVLNDGLILFPTAYAPEEVYEIDSAEDVVEVTSLMAAIEGQAN